LASNSSRRKPELLQEAEIHHRLDRAEEAAVVAREAAATGGAVA
jgi:hypothetical protein